MHLGWVPGSPQSALCDILWCLETDHVHTRHRQMLQVEVYSQESCLSLTHQSEPQAVHWSLSWLLTKHPMKATQGRKGLV